jgi:hypothetical protein
VKLLTNAFDDVQKADLFYNDNDIMTFRIQQIIDENGDDFEVIDSDDEDDEYFYEEVVEEVIEYEEEEIATGMGTPSSIPKRTSL